MINEIECLHLATYPNKYRLKSYTQWQTNYSVPIKANKNLIIEHKHNKLSLKEAKEPDSMCARQSR